MARMVNERGVALIKEFEGLRPEAYLCPAGRPTIGYGHTGAVRLGTRITAEEAERLLAEDLAGIGGEVERLVRVALNDDEYAALVSLAYNIGLDAFARSSVCRRLNAGDRIGAAQAFQMWVKATIKGEKVTLPGLVRRRAAEAALFLARVAAEAMPQAVES